MTPEQDAALAPLGGLDDVPWAGLRHAYGSAADVPGLLRALARPGEDPDRGERLDDLDAAVYHQGGAVYSAGAAVVPFLVEIACTPGLPLRAEIVELLGRFAALQNEMREPWRSAGSAVECRAALVAGHDGLVGLLDDAGAEVRTAAAALLWTYARWSPRAQDAARALVGRDAVEPDLRLRVLLRTQGARAAAAARAAEAPSAAPLMAAVDRLTRSPAHDADHDPDTDPDPDTDGLRLARLAARRRLDDPSVGWRDLLDAALAPATPQQAYRAWAEDGARLAPELCGMCGDDTAAWLNITRALIGDQRARVREGALRAAADAMLRWRSAVPELLPLVGGLLSDPEPEHRMMAADLLAAAGTADERLDDRLAAALDDPHRPTAVRAAWALARHGDPRALPALVRALDEDEEEDGFGPSAFYSGTSYWFTRPPLREALVACGERHGARLAPALRAALARCLTSSRTGHGTPGGLRADALPRLHLLCEALAACGPAAAVAGPELARLLDSTHPQLACTVVEAAGPAVADLAPQLERVGAEALVVAAARMSERYRDVALPGRPAPSGPPPGRRAEPGLADPWITALTTARAHFAVTGDGAALLRTVDQVLAVTAPLRRSVTGGGEGGRPGSAEEAAAAREAAALASALARCLAPLGPAAGAGRVGWTERWLRGNEGWWRSHEAVDVAWAHWRVTGDGDLARRVFARLLTRGPGQSFSPVELAALRRVAEAGPAARAPVPLLQACLDQDERIVGEGGWRGIVQDDEVQRLAAAALGGAAGAG
ncbi:HEAT repeat domain-containing protein [Kitasatospora indigofera]|uniref:HEAT repeat domain-containing protein n=1 Tax=Kitasatospora indigofera TaxID=67307 RepID=UPI00167E5580|nr:HEAT repeat domain-containing protein [Kitasatospora indigofera]